MKACCALAKRARALLLCLTAVASSVFLPVGGCSCSLTTLPPATTGLVGAVPFNEALAVKVTTSYDSSCTLLGTGPFTIEAEAPFSFVPAPSNTCGEDEIITFHVQVQAAASVGGGFGGVTTEATQVVMSSDMELVIDVEAAASAGGGAICVGGARTTRVTCEPKDQQDGGGGNDPIIYGLQQQVFLFEGQHSRWYNAIRSPRVDWNWKLEVFEECENGLEPTYFTATAMALKHSDGSVADRVLVEVLDTSDFFPGCPDDEPVETCLGEGNLRLTINDHVITTPGAYPLSDDGVVYAFNAFGPCTYKRDVHMQDFLLAEKAKKDLTAEERVRRRLSLRKEDRDLDPNGRQALSLLGSRLSKLEDGEACLPWLLAKREGGDLYRSNGGWASVYIQTADSFDFHIEYRQEVERCHSHSLDTFIVGSPSGAATDPTEWQGVLGETKQLRHDPVTGEAILRGREQVLSRSDDGDYEVEGPWGTDFEAWRVHHEG